MPETKTDPVQQCADRIMQQIDASRAIITREVIVAALKLAYATGRADQSSETVDRMAAELGKPA